LEKKADTLNHLDLFFLSLDVSDYQYKSLQDLLPKLHKLKTLITNDFAYDYDLSKIYNLSKMLFYNDLEILNVGRIRIYELSTIIENSEGRLKEVSLRFVNFLKYENNFIEDSLIFIRRIYENCPLIEYLSLIFSSSEDHFNELEKLLKVCQNLKLLTLFTKYNNISETKQNGEKLLEILIKSAPTNLREFRFFNNFQFSLETLEEFLEKWRGRPALSILTTDSTYEREDYKKLFNYYKNDGVIKAFGHESIANVENMYFKI
jgi:hypothetical protein